MVDVEAEKVKGSGSPETTKKHRFRQHNIIRKGVKLPSKTKVS